MVPKIIHRFWSGPEMPEEYRRFGESWARHHPEWEMKLWKDDNLPSLVHQKLYDQAETPCYKSELVRYEVVFQQGGIYVDTDFECLRSIEPLIEGLEAFSAQQYDDIQKPGAIACGFFGAVPGHPWIKDILDRIPHAWDPQLDTIGPPFFTSITLRHPEVKILDKKFFYPYNSWEKHRRAGPFPEAFAVHHWEGSWVKHHNVVLAARKAR